MKGQYCTVIEANCYDINKELNRLGKKGWEAYGSATFYHANGSSTHTAYLKRPKNESRKRVS